MSIRKFADSIPLLTPIRRYRYIRNTRHDLRANIAGQEKVRVILGCGKTRYAGWIGTDLPFFNILREEDWHFFFSRNKADNLLAEHVLEHLTEAQVRQVFTHAKAYLKDGGTFRIAVPDAYHTNQQYLDAVKPNGWDAGADDHKSFWNCDSLAALGAEADFTVQLLEYFGPNGSFSRAEYDNSNGFIGRSTLNGFVYAPIPQYTSLIVDLKKTA